MPSFDDLVSELTEFMMDPQPEPDGCLFSGRQAGRAAAADTAS